MQPVRASHPVQRPLSASRNTTTASSDFGVSTGLISQGYWEQSKWYFVNVERGNIADKLQPRNINDDRPFIVLTETKFRV